MMMNTDNMFSLRTLFCTAATLFIVCGSTWAQCPVPCNNGMLCDVSTKVCVCPPNTIHDEPNNRCLPVASSLGSGCELDAQCTKKLSQHSRCFENKCSCNENAININNRCELRKVLGDECSGNEYCKHIENAACTQNSCSCNDAYVPHPTNNMQCLQVATGFESPCQEDIQCSTSGLGSGSFCRDNKCQCQEGYHKFQAYQPQCLQNKGVQETCKPGECYLPQDGEKQNIDCIDGTCACKNDVQASHDNQSCSGSGGLELSFLTIFSFIVLTMFKCLS